jgi:hypothetical protein
MRRVLEAFGSGVVVYAVMAACSSSGGGGGVALDASAGGTSGNGGASTWDALTDNAVWDALTDPVSDAHAAPSQVKEAACTLAHVMFGATYYFAEIPFPGRTQQELSLASAFVKPPTPFDLPATGYEWLNTEYFVKDGSILVFCSIPSWASGGGLGHTARVVVPD